ncbi:MAG: hypothetical protein DMG61_16895 [Acidobacteria bacterium]|nr:MAG: hypothetical protein DMG61_16895 [Acidobacteriota bacterium]
MLRDLIQSWWLLHLRGILAVIFGGFLLFLAGTMRGLFGTTIALVGVMLMFVLYLICSGVLSILAAFKSFETRERFWAVLVHGALMFLLGLWLFFSNEVHVDVVGLAYCRERFRIGNSGMWSWPAQYLGILMPRR